MKTNYEIVSQVATQPWYLPTVETISTFRTTTWGQLVFQTSPIIHSR